MLLINICEDRTKASHHRSRTSVRPGDEKQSVSDVTAHRSEQPQRAEGAEDGVVGRVVEKKCKAVRRTLDKALPPRDELCAAGIQKDIEGCSRGIGRGIVTAAVPVDLAATNNGERARGIHIVVTESGAKGIDRTLN